MGDRKKELTKRFRKVAWGLLYWKHAHSSWRDFFDSDDIAVVYNAPVSIHYKSIEALLEDIQDAELNSVNNDCQRCGGDGLIVLGWDDYTYENEEITCPVCGGSGKMLPTNDL